MRSPPMYPRPAGRPPSRAGVEAKLPPRAGKSGRDCCARGRRVVPPFSPPPSEQPLWPARLRLCSRLTSTAEASSSTLEPQTAGKSRASAPPAGPLFFSRLGDDPRASARTAELRNEATEAAHEALLSAVLPSSPYIKGQDGGSGRVGPLFPTHHPAADLLL